MTTPVVPETAGPVPLRERAPAVVAVAVARVLAACAPRTIRAALTTARRGAVAARADDVLRARTAVVSVSRRCASQQCLQRSIATALLCRLRGSWPTWHTGVRIEPFRAHAWVSVDGEPIGEPASTALYRSLLTVGPVDRVPDAARRDA